MKNQSTAWLWLLLLKLKEWQQVWETVCCAGYRYDSLQATWQSIHSKTHQEENNGFIINPTVQKGNWGTKKSTDFPFLTWDVYGRAKSQVQSWSCTVMPSPDISTFSFLSRQIKPSPLQKTFHWSRHSKMGLQSCEWLNTEALHRRFSLTRCFARYNSPRQVKFPLYM